MFPPATDAMIADGFKLLRRPLEPDPRRLRRVRRPVRPGGAPHRDRLRLLDDGRDDGGDRPPAEFGFNFDPSHLLWQIVDPVGFLRDFPDRIYHVHVKDAKRQTGNGRNGRLGSHLNFGDPRRGWDFLSTGPRRRRGSSASGCSTRSATTARSRSSGRTPAWTVSSGAPEALEFVRRLAFDAPEAAFDAAFSTKD